MLAGHRSDVADLIHASDVVLVPSATEAWSRIVPESFAARCPVVASNIGGLPEIVHPGATGWLAEAGDIAGFTDRILEIRRDPRAPRLRWNAPAATPSRISGLAARCSTPWTPTSAPWARADAA